MYILLREYTYLFACLLGRALLFLGLCGIGLALGLALCAFFVDLEAFFAVAHFAVEI